MTIDLQRDNQVFILHMRAGENRFNSESLQALGRALDEVEAAQGPAALVTTGEGKFYSNGLDLEAMGRDQASAGRIVEATEQLLARVLSFPMATVAACNGHAFAAGAMFAVAHDYRVMRRDRGWLCFPEIDIKLPFTPFMDALIRARLPPATAHEAMVFGKRYSADEAVAGQIAHAAASQDDLLGTAVALAASLADKDRRTMAAIKRRMYGAVLQHRERE